MKKLIVVLFVLCSVIYGQEEIISSFNRGGWGIKAGLNIASVDIESFGSGFGSLYGFNFNFFNETPFSPALTFEWGLQYSMKGASSSDSYRDEWGGYIEEETYESKLILQYIECPILFRMHLPTQSSFDIYINTGILPGFNIQSDYEEDYYYYYNDGLGFEEEESYTDSEDITDEVKDFEFGLLFGGGVKIPTNSGSVLIDIKYDMGLTNIPDESGFEMTNEVWMLSLGYQFSK